MPTFIQTWRPDRCTLGFCRHELLFFKMPEKSFSKSEYEVNFEETGIQMQIKAQPVTLPRSDAACFFPSSEFWCEEISIFLEPNLRQCKSR